MKSHPGLRRKIAWQSQTSDAIGYDILSFDEDGTLQVATYCNISPFKNNSFDDVGVKYKDPSSLLMQIISMIYDENHNLVSAQGFIFVYLTMYDSNFKNFRNALIHGRNFLNGVDLALAFRCTLFSIAIMNCYLDRVNKN